MEGLSFSFVFISIVTAVVWIVIGWRAMRAHECIATSLERF